MKCPDEHRPQAEVWLENKFNIQIAMQEEDIHPLTGDFVPLCFRFDWGDFWTLTQ